jgi:amino acid transporter
LLLFAVPPESVETIATSGFPFGYILAQAINTKGAIGICIIMIVAIEIQLLAQIQTTSRFIFSLARDNAMPFSEQIRRTSASRVPVVAHWVTIALCAPFSLLVVANGETLHTVLAVAAGSLTFWAYVSLAIESADRRSFPSHCTYCPDEIFNPREERPGVYESLVSRAPSWGSCTPLR